MGAQIAGHDSRNQCTECWLACGRAGVRGGRVSRYTLGALAGVAFASLRPRCGARPKAARQNSLRALKALRSNNCRESDRDARCARRPRGCAPDYPRQRPQRIPPAAPTAAAGGATKARFDLRMTAHQQVLNPGCVARSDKPVQFAVRYRVSKRWWDRRRQKPAGAKPQQRAGLRPWRCPVASRCGRPPIRCGSAHSSGHKKRNPRRRWSQSAGPGCVSTSARRPVLRPRSRCGSCCR